MSKNILVIGGTRNVGYDLVLRLVAEGHRVTVLNRGIETAALPDSVAHLHADRTDPQQMRRALMARQYDAVVDFVLYKKAEAETIVQLLRGQTDHYIMISSGQVYLVREGIERPFDESEYEGRLQPAPKEHTYEYEEWLYGIDKRQAEDVLAAAWAEEQFPCTALRLPMVNSRRDPFNRLYNYILRVEDGGPILVPQTHDYALRHVTSDDVVQVIVDLIESGRGKGRAYNISQDETLSLEEFLAILGEHIGRTPDIVPVKYSVLVASGLRPGSSPFSERWMSELTNQRSREELGARYTPVREYLATLIDHYLTTRPPLPVEYRRRSAERQLVQPFLQG